MTQADRTPRLLVSVRDAAEAEVALAGGAHLIDVKEPAAGSLGRAADATIAAVVRCVAGRRPVSAALGELSPGAVPGAPPGLAYVKWGLAGWARTGGWQRQLRAMYPPGSRLAAPGLRPTNRRPQVVPVAYADCERAEAPPVQEVCAFVRRWSTVVLLDTFDKTANRTLLDYLSVGEIVRLCRSCRAAGVQVGLAGSLGVAHVEELRVAGPDWFGVRGAVCVDGRRGAPVSSTRVRDLVALLAAEVKVPVRGS